MRKISKLSLVAAVAVAGFSYANAQPLEEAIKNVEVSGSVVYRYDNFNDEYNSNQSTDTNKYKIALNLSSKINDDVKFNSRFLVGADNGDFAALESHNTNNDQNVNVTLSHANFAYTGIKNTTVIAGKQGLATPWTMAIDSDGNEHTGTGILALTTWGPVTAGAGYFNQTNLNQSTDINPTSISYVSNPNSSKPGYIPSGNAVIDNGGLKNAARNGVVTLNGNNNEELGTRDLYVGTLQADLSPVKLEAWYVDIADTLDSYTLVASANFKPADNAKLGVEARYVNLSLDNAEKITGIDGIDDNSMWKLMVNGSVGIVNFKADYLQTGSDGGLTAFDKDTQNTLLGWTLTSNGIPDAQHWDIRLGVNLLDNLELAAYYGNIQSDGDTKFGFEDYEGEEYYANLAYKMSKNLTTYVRYGNVSEEIGNGSDNETRDQDMGRLQIEYTF